MKTISTFAFALASSVLACGGASSQWDARAASSLHAEPEAVLHDMDSGNISDILARMDEDSVVFDTDENNQPVRMQGRAKVTEYFSGLEKAIKSDGVKFESKIARNDCVANEAFGFCVVEFDQTITAGGKKAGPFKYRGTFVARRVGDAWRWTHWHGSFREMPAPPSPKG
jgi:hypothetical protein